MFVDIAAMAEGHDHNQQHIVCHGVDDSVVPNPDSIPRSTAQRPGRGWARILGEQRNRASNSRPSLRVEFLQRPSGCGAELNSVRYRPSRGRP